jgi:hypothetical protein
MQEGRLQHMEDWLESVFISFSVESLVSGSIKYCSKAYYESLYSQPRSQILHFSEIHCQELPTLGRVTCHHF